MRPGEAAAVRWCDYDPAAQPLGRLKVNRAFSSRMRKVKSTKTGRARLVPVHPVLAGMLAEWRKTGWKEWMRRDPQDGDLVVPNRFGNNRQSTSSLRQFHADLCMLDLRRRRHYDTRRTFISMALDGGASYVHTMYLTHAPPQQEFWKYVTHEWQSLCGVMTCIRLPGRSASAGDRDVVDIAA